MLKNRSENALGISLFNNPYLKELVPISGLLGFMVLAVMMSALIPIVALGIFVFSEQLGLLQASNTHILEKIAAGVGSIIVFLSGLYVLLFHIPLPMKKNSFSIRWGFLYQLAPHPSDLAKFDR